MDETASPSYLCLHIDPWSDYVGAFDPRKVIGLVKRTFPETVIDWTDHQDMRLRGELEYGLLAHELLPKNQPRKSLTLIGRRIFD